MGAEINKIPRWLCGLLLRRRCCSASLAARVGQKRRSSASGWPFRPLAATVGPGRAVGPTVFLARWVQLICTPSTSRIGRRFGKFVDFKKEDVLRNSSILDELTPKK